MRKTFATVQCAEGKAACAIGVREHGIGVGVLGTMESANKQNEKKKRTKIYCVRKQ